MWNFSFGKSFNLIMRTLPFVLLRCVVYFGITVAYILVSGIGAGVGYGIGGFGDEGFRTSATLLGGLAGFAATGGVLYFLREYILYLVKAGHIAVMVQLLDNNELPDGKSQIKYAHNIVKERFTNTSVLFGLDLLIKGVVSAITGLIQGITRMLPVPGVDRIMGIVRAFLRVSVGLIDEIILAYIIKNNSENPWLASRSALVLYGQNASAMLKNAAWITAIVYVISFVVFLVMLAPAAALVYFMPGTWAAGSMVFALLFAWAIKAAIIEPFAIACLLQVYFNVTDGQTPNPEWESRLDNASTKFKDLKNKASNWAQTSSPKTKPETKPELTDET